VPTEKVPKEEDELMKDTAGCYGINKLVNQGRKGRQEREKSDLIDFPLGTRV